MNRLARLLLIAAIMLVLFGVSVPAQALSNPNDFNTMPVVPTISGAVGSHVRSLIWRGRAAGNRLNVFSKVGDSITRWDYFLNPIGAQRVQLGSFTDLSRVVSFFMRTKARTANSFANDSLAAHNAWTSADVLNPAWSPAGLCTPGETPLDCELRVTKPSIALIMIGTNDVPFDDVNRFRADLDRIVSITEKHYVVPVLSTIPIRRDDAKYIGRNGAYNQIIADVAAAHNVPLWNYWLAIAGLPANGVSSDGIHPSFPGDGQTAIFDSSHLQAGFTMRNLTALQVLKSLLTVMY